VLTVSFAKVRSISRWMAIGVATTLLFMAASTSGSAAHTASVTSGGCVGWWWSSFECSTLWAPAVNPFVRLAPQPVGEAEQTRATERDRKWLERCRPVVEPGRYGVPRYHYAAPNCEFGVGEF
jgi:hypothetical protein